MAQIVDAVAVRHHLKTKTIQELCDDYEHLIKSGRAMLWAEDAVSNELYSRDSAAWLEWAFEGNLFGRPMPHRFFGLV